MTPSAFSQRRMCSACPRMCAPPSPQHGMRNGLLTSIAPTGTISLLAGNVSSGVEPVFDFRYERRVLERDGGSRTETVEDYAHALFREKFGPDGAAAAGVRDAPRSLRPREHLEMQAALQRHVDSSISKTINCPAGIELRGLQGRLPARPTIWGSRAAPPTAPTR